MKSSRVSVTGFKLKDMEKDVIIQISTRCPEKWVLIDIEDAYVYTRSNSGDSWLMPKKQHLKAALKVLDHSIKNKQNRA